MTAGRLVGRRALVTGASRGIGASVAFAFAQQGASVVLGTSPEPPFVAQAAKAVELIRSLGGESSVAVADLRHDQAVAGLIDEAVSYMGGLDIVVANAALSRVGPLQGTTPSDWDDVLAVNVKSAGLLARGSAGFLAERGGSLVTVSSVMALLGAADASVYATSKAAVIGLTRSLARELGPRGIRVNCVVPGAIRTEHEAETHGTSTELDERLIAQQSLKRRGTADDLSGTFVYLASEESSFVTGQSIVVDGGWVLC